MAKTLNIPGLTLVVVICLCCACSKSPQKPPIQIAPPDRGEIMCSQDAMQCPDGSWVGRSGASCEFVCPSGDTSK